MKRSRASASSSFISTASVLPSSAAGSLLVEFILFWLVQQSHGFHQSVLTTNKNNRGRMLGELLERPSTTTRATSNANQFSFMHNYPTTSTRTTSTTSTSTALFATVAKPTSTASNPSSSSSSSSATTKHNSNKQSQQNQHQHTQTKRQKPKRHVIKSMFQQAKAMERKGQWNLACENFEHILDLDPQDAHSHLALARLQARRESPAATSTSTSTTTTASTATTTSTTCTTPTLAQQAFERGTQQCPDSIHLWQAWAVYEETKGNLDRAKQLFERALQIDAYNPYVCHAYGLLEKTKNNHRQNAQELWERALTKTSTAALVCSLGELLIEQGQYEQAQQLYQYHLQHKLLKQAKDKTEVYLALAWLEERYLQNYESAQQWLHKALEVFPSSSLAHVALARLEGRRPRQDPVEAKKATVRRLARACMMDLEQQQQPKQQQQQQQQQSLNSNSNDDSDTANKNKNRHSLQQKQKQQSTADKPKDGRIFNAWAHLEVQDRKFDKAQKILARGISRYPDDQMVRT
mgnify:CR=1 FL=1